MPNAIVPLMRQLFWIACVGIGLAVASIEGQSRTTVGKVVGTIVDSRSGRPVAQADVRIRVAGPPVVPVVSRRADLPSPDLAATPREFKITADDDGQFTFANVSPGDYLLSATGMDGLGWIMPLVGGVPLEIPVTVADGGTRDVGRVVLWETSVVGGKVRDARQEPLVGWEVRAWLRLSLDRWTFVGTATTDDRGDYRIAHVPPGPVIVGVVVSPAVQPANLSGRRIATPTDIESELRLSGAQVASGGLSVGSDLLVLMRAPDGNAFFPIVKRPDGGVEAFRTTFSASTVLASAAIAVTLQPGDHRFDANIDLGTAPVRSVSGRLLGPKGPLANTKIQMVSADNVQLPGLDWPTVITDASGRFDFPFVVDGDYELKAFRAGVAPVSVNVKRNGDKAVGTFVAPPAQTSPEEQPTLWLSRSISVRGLAAKDLDLLMSPGFTVSGQLYYVGNPTPAPGAPVFEQISLRPVAGSLMLPAGTSSTSQAGEFLSAGYPGGTYRLAGAFATDGIPWFVDSALYSGVDISDLPFTLDRDIRGVAVTLTRRLSGITGTVNRSTGGIQSDGLVMAFSSDPSTWGRSVRRIGRSPVDGSGRFSIRGLPSGNYFVVWIDVAAPAMDLADPETFKHLSSRGHLVTVSKGLDAEVKLGAGGA